MPKIQMASYRRGGVKNFTNLEEQLAHDEL